jgi:acyl-CoA hydrolase
MFDLFEKNKLNFVTTTSIALSNKKFEKFYNNFDSYKNKICIRPENISNNVEIIRRLGIVSMNSVIEAGIFYIKKIYTDM